MSELRAHVYLHEHLAGTLEVTSTGSRFVYNDDYRARGGRPIFPGLAVNADHVRLDGRMLAFFANLAWDRGLFERAPKRSARETLAILLQRGDDLPGAVRVVPEGERAQ